MAERPRLELYCDSGNLDEIRDYAKLSGFVQGFTTNPGLLGSGKSYRDTLSEILDLAAGRPVSAEVVTDDPAGMERQAARLLEWAAGRPLYVKVPIVHRDSSLTGAVLRRLAANAVPLNVTCIFTAEHVEVALDALRNTKAPAILSVFAGRIADTGRNPTTLCRYAAGYLYRERRPNIKLLWASAREVLNVQQAADAGCNIITLSPQLLAKYSLSWGKGLHGFAVQTVSEFLDAAEQKRLCIENGQEIQE